VTYLGQTLETANGYTITVVRRYEIECSDCGPISTHEDGYTVPETRADAFEVQREHRAYHAKWESVSYESDHNARPQA
jgi:hypothetical protein